VGILVIIIMMIMYARTVFLYAVLLAVSFIEGSQATLQARDAIPLGNVSFFPLVPHHVLSDFALSASPSVSSMTMLSFNPLPQPTSCASTTFSWSYSGPDGPLFLQITNVNVPQGPPPSTTTASTTITSASVSIATTRNLVRSAPPLPSSPMDFTASVVANYNPSFLAYVWNPVNVAQGWYSLLATIPSDPSYQTSSLPFFIHTGSNISCLAGIISATNTHTPTITPSTSSSSQRPVISLPASDLSSTSTSKVPTIVGVTVGMSVLVIGLLLLWFILMRKRKSRTSDDGNSKNSFHRWKSLSDSRGAGGGFDANVPNKRFQSSRSHLTSQPASFVSTLGPGFEEDGILGAEKESPQGLALSTLPVLHHQSSRTRPDHTYSASSSSSNLNDFVGNKSFIRYSNQQHSIDPSAVYPPSLTFPSRESGNQHMVAGAAPGVFRSHSLSSTTNSVDPSSFQPPPSIASRETKQMHRQSIGKKRKPAPVYDPSEDEPTTNISSSSSSSTTSSPIFAFPHHNTEFPELSHKSSFGPGGIEGKPLHYLIPDMPMSHTS
jgi:hypothetical protein